MRDQGEASGQRPDGGRGGGTWQGQKYRCSHGSVEGGSSACTCMAQSLTGPLALTLTCSDSHTLTSWTHNRCQGACLRHSCVCRSEVGAQVVTGNNTHTGRL